MTSSGHRWFNRVLLGLSWLGLWNSVEEIPIEDWKFIISLLITIFSLYLEYLNRKAQIAERTS